jgi:hypothetical protein
LEEFDYGNVVLIQNCPLDWNVITAMVMRWSTEHHTFALPSGECTVTLQYVNMLLYVQIYGEALSKKCVSVWDQFERLLGVPPPTTRDVLTIRTIWLQAQLGTMSVDPTYEQLMQHPRMYLLYFLGRFLLPNKSKTAIWPHQYPVFKRVCITQF